MIDRSLTAFLAALDDAVASSQFVLLKLSKPNASAGDVTAIDIRPIQVKRVLMLSFTFHHQTHDIVKNFTPAESTQRIGDLLSRTFTAAKLCALNGDMHLAKKGADFTLTHHKASHTTPPPLTHDRARNRLIESANKPYLHALGISDAKGVVYKNASDKFRQINKYIEILDGLIAPLPTSRTLRIVDMGAGKGYLTFALYDHLTNSLHREVAVVGVETRADLVTLCNGIAQKAGFTGLQFVQGTIADFDCAGADIVIALHACDTATDDALAKAVRANASLIVVAPCCHKQIRRAMVKTIGGHPLEFMLKYGSYAERLAEMATDAMRAQLLEISGYKTNVFEFIGGEHTPKNVMIVASKLPTTPNANDIAKLRAALAASKAQFGITTHALEPLLEVMD
jgi:SAM-dependent methyltransferase